MLFFDDIKQFDLDNKKLIGVDETGVGDYFTPLVACAVYLPSELSRFILELGVKDSKKLSDSKIMQIAPKLMSFLPYSTYVLSQSGYNKLSKDYNANELKFFIHASALSNLYQYQNKSHEATGIIIDKYSTTNSILKYHQKIFMFNNWAKINELNLPTLLVEKAEDIHLSVACASIIARYKLLEYMQKQNQQWNFEFSLGAGQKVKQQVSEFVEIYGEKALNEVCKTNFKM
ncbi:ribonuclease HIII [Mycoplasma sp. Pen4]|uniref:ribonuclease HIII n=1 Tax=Mycoplasma sp. Pen4 TaxID=640330 RepID=UPI00165464CF|nr:ribonuclease HIII [Mycoplasma sp. Pen4]QNM93634.1 ribonuclease HIII [Mycoplasma sp. Pen4]